MSQVSHAFTILFHGNCIDGWFSAYLGYIALKLSGTVQLFPIAPTPSPHWPKPEVMKDTHILLLDVSVEKKYRDEWEAAGALSVDCFDHHASACCHWDEKDKIKVEHCAAMQTFAHFYPKNEIPFWLHSIDRVDRWDKPTYEDRCLREVMHVLAHMPVDKKSCEEALQATDAFVQRLLDPAEVVKILAEGKVILDAKDARLFQILNQWGKMVLITPELTGQWNLPVEWQGINAFIMDNSAATIDSTEAAHQVFSHYPGVDVFVNYRKRPINKQGKKKTVYVYSARSQTMNVTNGTVFQGHPTAAGASLIADEVMVLPFVLS